MYNISIYPDRQATDRLNAVDVWESLLASCGDHIDVAILQLARAGYTRQETACKAKVNISTVYRRLQGILARYKQA